MKIIKSKSKIWTDMIDITRSLFYEEQKLCPLCENPIEKGNFFCSECVENYFKVEPGRCNNCGKLMSDNQKLCNDCEAGKGPKSLDKVVAWGYYSGEWREFIQAVKFKSQPYKLRLIIKPFADWAIKMLPPPQALVPVPMHYERLAERGFNQAQAIASLIHWELGIPLVDCLQRTRRTLPQVGLSRQERLNNLRDAFEVTEEEKNIRGKRIWLVDDVITTGATLDACAHSLRQGGAKEVYGLILAAGKEKKTIHRNHSMV